MSDNTMTFNWTREDSDSFRGWVYLHLITGNQEAQDKAFSDEVKTEGLTLDIYANGVHCDANEFFERLERNYDYAVNQGVKNLAMDRLRAISGFRELDEALGKITGVIQHKLVEELEKAGIYISEDDLRYY